MATLINSNKTNIAFANISVLGYSIPPPTTLSIRVDTRAFPERVLTNCVAI